MVVTYSEKANKYVIPGRCAELRIQVFDVSPVKCPLRTLTWSFFLLDLNISKLRSVPEAF